MASATLGIAYFENELTADDAADSIRGFAAAAV